MTAVDDFLLREVRLVPLAALTPPADVAAVDVRVQAGRIIEVGPSLARPDGCAELSADGAWLLPGLWDAHVHLQQWLLARQRLDLGPAGSVAEALDLVTRHLRDRPSAAVIGWGHRPATWAEQPTTAALDVVAGDREVVLIGGDGHHAWLSTAAQRRFALPPVRETVTEGDWFRLYPRLAELGVDDTSPAAYRDAMAAAAALGVVGVVDLEFLTGPGEWAERRESGADLLAVRVGTYPETLDDYLALGLRTGDVLPGCDSGVTMGPLKIISDGSLNTRTAWCCEPYADGDRLDNPSGAPNYTLGELDALAARAAANGLELATHAIGDAAVAVALDVHERHRPGGSIEHAQLIRRPQATRMAVLGLRASVQPAHLIDDRDVTEQCWPDRAGRSFALRWLADAGVRLTLGSDAPVAALDPWLAVAAAQRRTGDERPAWHPEQALTRREALAASVDGVTVDVGAPADLVLMADDPLAEECVRPEVLATWRAGRLIHGYLA